MKYIILKKDPPIVAGDVLSCLDETMDRTITGYIVRVAKNNALKDYDVCIRWNDLFVVFRRIGLQELLRNVKMGLWKHRSSQACYKKKKAINEVCTLSRYTY